MRAPTVLALLAVLPLLALAAPSGALGARLVFTGVGQYVPEHPGDTCPPQLPAEMVIRTTPTDDTARIALVVGLVHVHPEAGQDPDHPLLPPSVCLRQWEFVGSGHPQSGYRGQAPGGLNILVSALGGATYVSVYSFNGGVLWDEGRGTFDFRPFVV
jgi:hypothetical protein